MKVGESVAWPLKFLGSFADRSSAYSKALSVHQVELFAPIVSQGAVFEAHCVREPSIRKRQMVL